MAHQQAAAKAQAVMFPCLHAQAARQYRARLSPHQKRQTMLRFAMRGFDVGAATVFCIDQPMARGMFWGTMVGLFTGRVVATFAPHRRVVEPTGTGRDV